MILLRLSRGLAGTKEAFRAWYGNIGCLRSYFKEQNLVVCTATATSDTKSKIFEVLDMSKEKTVCIEKSPERSNLVYSFHYIDNDLELQNIFNEVITEVQEKGGKCARTIIYCQTRKQAALVWRAFKVSLGKGMYVNGTMQAKDSFVEMFHSGTPDTSKQHILKSVSFPDGHVRVLICTIAFGMGIDIKAARKVIHFGPSQTVESYLQECGRVGRDGVQSQCILFYNGLLTSRCSADMKELINNKDRCHRRKILKHFSGDHEIVVEGCQCCNVCTQECLCSGMKGGCAKTFQYNFSSCETPYTYVNQRIITNEMKKKLKIKLLAYGDTLGKGASKQVLFPNLHMEFGSVQITQIIDNAHKLFSVMDIMNCVEIWRSEHALEVLKILSELFKDVDIPELVMDCSDDLVDDIIDTDWMDIRDDSAADLMSLQDSFSEMSQNTSEMYLSTAGKLLDTSAVIRDIANEATAFYNSH
jgi:ATP-dependent DNA helicase RecQ